MKETIINLGGEGEVPHAININHPAILDENWRCSRSGCPLKEIKERGPVIICCSDQLPLCDNCADKIIVNDAPIDKKTWIGPGYSTEEIKRINKNKNIINTNISHPHLSLQSMFHPNE